MAEVINLNRARKSRDKAHAKRTAEANRITHGRTKSEREATAKERDRTTTHLDGHKRED